MIKRLVSWLNKISSAQTVIITLGIFLLFTALVLPSQSRIAEERTGGGDSPDTSFFYTQDDLFRMAEQYGEEGRQAYVRARYTFDVIWPLVYLAFLTTGIGWFGNQLSLKKPLLDWAVLVPWLATLFDYLENAAASLVMAFYPLQLAIPAGLAPLFTMLKWIFIYSAFALYLIGGVAALLQKLKNARQTSLPK